MGFFKHLWDGIHHYLTDTNTWETFANKALAIIFILIVAFIAVRVGRSALRKIFKSRKNSRLRMSEKRETTMERLVENAYSYVVYFIALVMILNQFVQVKGLLAGAGIAGLAIGFGAQSLVKDIITGFFIIFEDQFAVGDYIQVGKFTGYVEQIGLRTTKIQSWTGEMHIIPNSSINEVTNYSVTNSIAVVDISIAYEEDIERAERVIDEVVGEMAAIHPEMVRPPEILGVQILGTSDVVIRVTSEVLPMEHWHIGREIRKAVKQRFDKEGIEIPYPRIVTYRRDELEAVEKHMQKDDGDGR